MDTWTWGPLVVQKNMLLAVLAAAAGYGLLKLRMNRTMVGAALGPIMLNAVMIWIVSWKLSLLLFDAKSVLHNPVSLLYFSGGERGAWIAALLAAIYVWLSAKKEKLGIPVYIDSALLSVFGGYTVYLFFLFATGEGNRLTLGLCTLAGTALTVLWLRSKPAGQVRFTVQWAVMFVIGYALIQALAVNIWEKPGSETVQAGENAGLKTGQQAPDFELILLSGESVKLSDYRGRTVILNFWATWCPPCRAEMPYMQQYYADHEKEGVVVLGVNATSTEASEKVVDAWIKEWGIRFPIALDRQGEVGKTYRVNAYPATYVIDGEGIIRHKHPGPMNAEMLKEAAAKARRGK